MAGKENTAEKQEQTQTQEPSFEEKVRAVLDKEGYTKPNGFFSVVIGHPIAHLMSPGFSNKAEGAVDLGGRVGIGYGAYKLIRYGINKIWG